MFELIDAIGLDTILVIVVLGLVGSGWGIRRSYRDQSR
jgi:hypothetical protein